MRETVASRYQEEKDNWLSFRRNKCSLYACIPTLIGILLEIVTGNVIPCIVGLVVTVALFAMFLPGINGSIMMNRFGMLGENIVRNSLRQVGLSDDYAAFYNVAYRKKNGGLTDIDCVLIGPSGVFAIEVKHYSGVIHHDGNRWVRAKRSAWGNVYGGYIGNPSGQLYAGIRKLKEILAPDGKGAPFVDGILVFSHPESLFDAPHLKNIAVIRPHQLVGFVKTNKSLAMGRCEKFKAKLENHILSVQQK